MKRTLTAVILLVLAFMFTCSAAMAEGADLTETTPLKFNLAYGNKSRTMTYNQSAPLTLSNGEVITAGMLKPMWSYLEAKLNSKFTDVTLQDATAANMIQTESTTGFAGANIYGGNNVSDALMRYGAEGRFVNLTELMDKGLMPSFKAYLDANPNVKAYITAYDGNIYYIPYIAEVGEIARSVNIRQTWVTALLDAQGAAYDEAAFATHYDGFYTGDKARTGDNGGTVTPMAGVTVTKKTGTNIIEIQNALEVKNGKTLTEAFVQYIKDNYGYEKPSELFLGNKAAYDIDELIALFRCIKANPAYLTQGKAQVVWPFFSRQSDYREDLLRFATYFDGVKVHGSDSYGARWFIDAQGDVQYTYAQESLYDVLCIFSDLEAEGLLYSDMYDLTNKTNFRSTLWGTDASETPSYGFLTYDFIASSTANSLNPDIVVILPPVAKVNGVWQYYMDNSRVVKPDGWAISVAGSTEAEVNRAAALFDYFFTEEGALLQNYGLPFDLKEDESYQGPDGKAWPKYKPWVVESASALAKGDLSTFLRDWLGCQMPIGYPKQIGFEYQYTSQRGFDGWKLLKESTLTIPTYAGTGPEGENPNYYTLIPPGFSLTKRQQETINDTTAFVDADITDFIFNVIRYKTLGNAPEGALVAKSYEEYLKFFQDRGLDVFVATYQAAYQNMIQ